MLPNRKLMQYHLLYSTFIRLTSVSQAIERKLLLKESKSDVKHWLKIRKKWRTSRMSTERNTQRNNPEKKCHSSKIEWIKVKGAMLRVYLFFPRWELTRVHEPIVPSSYWLAILYIGKFCYTIHKSVFVAFVWNYEMNHGTTQYINE